MEEKVANETKDEFQASAQPSEHVDNIELPESTVEATANRHRITREDAVKQMHQAFRNMRLCCE